MTHATPGAADHARAGTRERANILTHTQLTILEYLSVHGPASSAQVAQAFGVAQATARQHLHNLRVAGRVKPTSKGPTSKWKLREQEPDETPQRHSAFLRGDETSPIWQCPSIWVYAARVAAHAAQRG